MKGLIWINFFVAGWLIFTAWSVPDHRIAVPSHNDGATALVLAALAAWTLTSRAERPLALWLQMAVGAWLIVAPFVWRYSPWNDVPTGMLALALAVLAARPAGVAA